VNNEQDEWCKHIVVLRPVQGFMRPLYIAQSQALSGEYVNKGEDRGMWQNGAVFQYTLSGQGVIDINGTTHILDAGKGFCCYIGDPKISYYYPKDGKEPWNFLFVAYRDNAGITRSLNEHCGHVFSIDQSEPQIQQLLSYQKIKSNTVELTQGAAHLFINSILGMLTDLSVENTSHLKAQERHVRQALKVIDNNLHSPLNVSMLARELSVSPEYLTRIFREVIEQTPYQCICKIKMHQACERLKNSNSNVARIAEELGYEPGSHFSRLFKRVIGVTPGVFRKKLSLPLKLY